MRKSVKNLMILTIVFFVLALGNFIIWPYLVQLFAGQGAVAETTIGSSILNFYSTASGLPSSGYLIPDIVTATLSSIGDLFMFTSTSIGQTISLVLLGHVVVLSVLWLILVIARKKTPSIAAMIFGIITMFGSFFILFSYCFLITGIDGVRTNLFLLLFREFQAGNCPFYVILFVVLCLIFAVLTYVLSVIESLVDMCSRRRRRYEEGLPVDEDVDKQTLTSVDELRSLLDEENKKGEERKNVQPAPQQFAYPTPQQPFIFQQFFGGVPVQQTVSPTGEVKQPEPAKQEVKPSLTEEQVRNIVHEQIVNSLNATKAKEEMHGELPIGYGNEIRNIIREELSNLDIVFEEKPFPSDEVRSIVRNELSNLDVTFEDSPFPSDEVRSIVRDELSNLDIELEEKPFPSDEIRAIVHDELNQVVVKTEPEPQIIHEIIREVPVEKIVEKVVVKEAEPVKEVVPEPAKEEPQPETVKEEPVKEEPVKEVVSEPVKEEPQPEPVKEEPVQEVAPETVVEEKAKIIRIPFTDRVRIMDEDMRKNFNELKSDIMAYGVKSRVSNSGDTFRLHTKTYVKITIAGKSLKLYFALDPKDYADSTLPIADAGHKGIYKEIPLVFKVKSDLSLRRAKQLIADAMAKDNLVQGNVEEKDWIQEIIDTVPASGKLEEAGLNDEDEE